MLLRTPIPCNLHRAEHPPGSAPSEGLELGGWQPAFSCGSPTPGAEFGLFPTLRGARWAPGAGLLGAGAGRRPRATFPAAAALESRAALQMRGIPQLPRPEVGKARGEVDLEEP